MNEKIARANILLAKSLLRRRIRFPKISLREMLVAEDLISAGREILSQYIQKKISRRR